MKFLVTGSSGHLGEALVRTLKDAGRDVAGLDITPSPFTDIVGSIIERERVRQVIRGIATVLHTATLHKPHVATHGRQQFVDTNITGTLNLLEESVAAGVVAFVFTSTTSVFGRALTPPPGEPAASSTYDVRPVSRHIYGGSYAAAEDLCELFHSRHALPCLILRTSRFFPEEDDDPFVRRDYADGNVKANEFLYRRVELADVVDAHLLAADKAPALGFGRYIISATTPFRPDDLPALRRNAPEVVRRLFPDYEAQYARRGWTMFPGIDRVYVNERAEAGLGWRPRYDFRRALDLLKADRDWRSPLAETAGQKGYHRGRFAGGNYPVS